MSVYFLRGFKVSSNWGLNEDPNINTKPLNCPVHIGLRRNPKLFKWPLHESLNPLSVQGNANSPLTSPKRFLTPEPLT